MYKGGGNMDYGKLTFEELKKGYHHDQDTDQYICNYCHQQFEVGQVYLIGDKFYDAKHAVTKHLIAIHGSNQLQLISSTTKYNTLTKNQKELLTLFGCGMSDKEMAKKLDVSEATIRRQRFTFREKAKQAKLFLAIYEQVFADKSTNDKNIVPIHNNAIYVDDRYLISQEEQQHILETSFSSLEPLVLKKFSPKEKKKVVILTKIAQQFKRNTKYSENEVNQILKFIYDDYITLRRYLIMYGFMERTNDGSEYWLTE